MFAKAIVDPKIQNKCMKYKDGVTKVKGVPDHPFGLMEGLSGEICFLSDILRDENDVRFPGFEI